MSATPDPPEIPLKDFKKYQAKDVTRSAKGATFAREFMRSALAFFSLILLMGTVYLGWRASQGNDWDQAKEWMQAVLPAETAILGSAVGFYFGRSNKND